MPTSRRPVRWPRYPHGAEGPLTEPTSPAAPGAEPDTVIDTTAEVGDKKLTVLVEAWITTMIRVPRFLTISEAAPPPPMGGEQERSTVALGGLLGLLSAELRLSHLPDPFVAFNRRVLHPWLTRRRLVKEARALGIEPRFARVLAARFEVIWRSGVAHELPRADQAARIVALLQQPER